jgi:hypothetical protein
MRFMPAAPPAGRAVLAALAALATVLTAQLPERLQTTLFVPKDQSGPLPVLLQRTPYGAAGRNFQISRVL